MCNLGVQVNHFLDTAVYRNLRFAVVFFDNNAIISELPDDINPNQLGHKQYWVSKQQVED